MGKNRKNKKGGPKRVCNPFEIKPIKEKFKIHGKKIKNSIGQPGLSRSKDIEKRKKTLLVEYKNLHRTNSIQDRRFAERDSSTSLRDKMMKRSGFERKKTAESSVPMWVEAEHVPVSHKRHSVLNQEHFDASSDSDDSDDFEGALQESAVDELFGVKGGEHGESQGGKKGFADRMMEIIDQSKRERSLKKMEKEKNMEETMELNKEFDALQKGGADVFLIGEKKESAEEILKKALERGKEKSEKPTSQPAAQPEEDRYNSIMNQLKFEAKAPSTSRKKTVEELAKEEKTRLEKLEADRQRRMQCVGPNTGATHISADALDDDWDVILSSEAAMKKRVGFNFGDESEEEQDDNEDNDSDEGDDEEDEDQDSEEGENDGDGENDEEEGDEEEEDEEEEEETDGEEAEVKEKEAEKSKSAPNTKSILKKRELTEEEKQKMQEEAEKAKNELPYTYPAPKSYEEFEKLVEKYPISDRLTVVSRLVACHHASLADGNKQKMERLLPFLVQYLGQLPLETAEGRKLSRDLVTPIHGLAVRFPGTAARAVNKCLLDVHQRYSQLRDEHEGRGKFPPLCELQYLVLVSKLFPTSDFRHDVCTRALSFLLQLLRECPVRSEKDVISGILLTALCLEYVLLSKRYVNEPLTFLHGLLFLAIRKEPNKFETVFPPFTPISKFVDLLQLKKKESSRNVTPAKLEASMLFESPEKLRTDEFRVSALHTVLGLVQEFSSLWEELQAHRETFSIFTSLASKLPASAYPTVVQERLAAVLEHVRKSGTKARSFLVFREEKPATIAMLEPRFDVKRQMKKDLYLNKDKRELKVLRNKVKKEKRSAIREIRKDTAFISRLKLEETKKADAERKRKVKELMGHLANQEGDYRKIKKMKK